ncbi:MAG TPA: hypothetical protein VIS49_01195 [Cyclobacteriaceae bacterium]
MIVFVMVQMAIIVNAQSKLYISGGLSHVFGSGVNIFIGQEDFKFDFKYGILDIEYEKRVVGSFNFLTGASLFSSGYKTTDDSFSSLSDFKATYMAVPLMVRWNVGNKNMYYLDFGLSPYYLADAHLTESITRFGNTITVSGDIANYSNRFYYASKVQMIILLNRFSIGAYFIFPGKGQTTLKNLEGNWGLNKQQSTYLLSNGFSDYQIIGFKAGWRIL